MVNGSIEIERVIMCLTYRLQQTVNHISSVILHYSATKLLPSCISNNLRCEIFVLSANWEEQGRLDCKTLTFKWLTIVVIRARQLNSCNPEVVVLRAMAIYLIIVHGRTFHWV